MTQHIDISSNKNANKPFALARRTQVFIVVGMVLLLGTGMSVSHLFGNVPEAKAIQAPPSGTFRPTKEQWASLGIAPVQVMNFRSEQITEGAIAYNDDTTTQVFSPYSGRVTRVIAKLGDFVKKGDPLMVVAASEFVQAKNNLITAHAQVNLTTASEKRQHELYLAKAGALKDWLQSQSDLATAGGNLQAARNQLSILGKSEHEISAIENEAKTSETNPESIVRAPVSGTVTQRQVGLGQFIQSASSGATAAVYTIGNLSTVWLIANVREGDIPLMRVGQPVEVQVLPYPERVFKAKIAWIAPAVDLNTHRLQVRAEMNNSDGALKPMMFANFSIITSGEASSSIGVPENAVVFEGSDAHVFVANSDGTLALRPIRLGRTNGDKLEVTSGLAAGEKIVTRGSLFIDRATEGN